MPTSWRVPTVRIFAAHGVECLASFDELPSYPASMQVQQHRAWLVPNEIHSRSPQSWILFQTSLLGRNSEVSGDVSTTLVFTQELDHQGTGVMDIRHLGRCWEWTGYHDKRLRCLPVWSCVRRLCRLVEPCEANLLSLMPLFYFYSLLLVTRTAVGAHWPSGPGHSRGLQTWCRMLCWLPFSSLHKAPGEKPSAGRSGESSGNSPVLSPSVNEFSTSLHNFGFHWSSSVRPPIWECRM